MDNLARKFEEFAIQLIEEDRHKEITGEAFFDYAEVQEELRSDFALAAIMRQVDWDIIEAKIREKEIENYVENA